MTNPKISVEIFHDIDNEYDMTESALEGVTLVNAFARALEVTRTTRKLRVNHSPEQPLTASNVTWPTFDTPLSIVLTHRPIIQTGRQDSAYGVALEPENIAIVSATAPRPATTVAHELGHLLHARYSGNNNHCSNESCVMHSYVQPDKIVSRRVKKRGIAGWMERNGYRPAEYTRGYEQSNGEFCSPCKEQLAKRAFFMAKHLQGEDIPEFLR